MNRDDSYRLAKVGAFVSLALMMLVVVVAMLGRSRSLFASKSLLHTEFDNISGLTVGSPVRLAGVDIGMVQKIHFDADPKRKRVRVVLGVQTSYLTRIREDSVAHLSSKGLLGDMLINITVGSAELAPLKGGSHLASAESQGMTEVVSAVQDGIGEVRHLVGQVDGRVRVMLSDEVAHDFQRMMRSTANLMEGIEKGNGVLHDLVYKHSLAQSLAGLSGEAQQAALHLHHVMARIDHVMAAIEQGQGTLHSLIYGDQGSKLIAELRNASADLAAVVSEVRRGKGPLHALIFNDKSNMLGDLAATARILRVLAEETQQGRGTVGGLLKDPSVYEDLKQILGTVKRNTLLKLLIRSAINRDGLLRSANPK